MWLKPRDSEVLVHQPFTGFFLGGGGVEPFHMNCVPQLKNMLLNIEQSAGQRPNIVYHSHETRLNPFLFLFQSRTLLKNLFVFAILLTLRTPWSSFPVFKIRKL
jgi:hypothetical protein